MNADEELEAEQTLLILDGMLEAQGRREEVFHIVERARDTDEAIKQLGEEFGFDEFVARVVLDMQVRRWLGDQRGALASEADRIRATLGRGEGSI